MEAGANCGLHPLIHTLLKFNLAQNIERINKRSQSSEGVFVKLILALRGRKLL